MTKFQSQARMSNRPWTPRNPIPSSVAYSYMGADVLATHQILVLYQKRQSGLLPNFIASVVCH